MITKKTLTPFIYCVISTTAVNAQDHIVPPMVNIPEGEFIFGANGGDKNANPNHKIKVAKFQLAKYPVTVAEFKKFVEDTGYTQSEKCDDYIDHDWFRGPEHEGTGSWDNNRFLTNEYQPVTCVSWQGVQAYTKWLSEKTGIEYRLPTEQEWEYSAKANTTSRFYWGDDLDMTQACQYGNFPDLSTEYFASKQYNASLVGYVGHVNCDDGEPYTSIVGMYRPNPFGLYDMAGNTFEYVGSCYYEDKFKTLTKEENDISQCEAITLKSRSWFGISEPFGQRRQDKVKKWKPGKLTGFRLAANGHNINISPSTAAFEAELNQAQRTRSAAREKLPMAPENTQLQSLQDGKFKLSWNAVNDPRVKGYEIHKSKLPHAHLIGFAYRNYYEKAWVVDANVNTIDVPLGDEGGSFRVVTVTDKLTSLPSEPAFYKEIETLDIPGRINVEESKSSKDAPLLYIEQDDGAGFYYIYKYNDEFAQSTSEANFNINVKKTAWYNVNYKGVTYHKGELFKLWSGNKLLGEIGFDPDIDDKTSNRHKVFLERGNHELQLSIVRNGFDKAGVAWLEFTEVTSDPEGNIAE